MSAQTLSRLIRDLDEAVCEFHRAPLVDEWVYLFLDRASLRVQRPTGRKRVQMLVTYGVGRTAAIAGFFAQPRREAKRLGRTVGRFVPARVAGREPAVDSDRRLRGLGGGDPDGLSARAASTLGAQDAQYPRDTLNKHCF